MKIYSFRAAIGFLILFLSVILLLTTSGIIPWGIWLFVWQFWPMLFIIFGIAFLIKRWNLNFFVGIFIFTVIFGLMSTGLWLSWKNQYFNTDNFAEENTVTETRISNELSKKTETADVKIIFGAAKIKIGALEEENNGFLYKGNHNTNFFRLSEKLETVGEKAKLTLKTSPFIKKPFSPKSINELDINFSQKPEYSFDISSGASSFDLNFEKFKVKDLDIDAGASEMEIKMGEKSDSDIKVKSGANSLKFYVSKNSRIKISSKSALLSNNFEEIGLVKKNSSWESPSRESEKNKIDIDIDSGVSKIEILFY
jgi:hypothetical protein